MKKSLVLGVVAVMSIAATLPSRAENAIITYKSLAPDTAFILARAALLQCRKDGYQVAVVVIDRFGHPLVMMRDRYAGLAAPDVATRKAWTAVNYTRNTSDLAQALKAGDLSPALANIPNTLFAAGGLVIQGGGSLLGGVGVAGAPGGDKDEACAKAGLASVQDQLEF